MVFLVFWYFWWYMYKYFVYMKWKNHHRQLIIRNKKKICVFSYWEFSLLLDMSGFWMYDAHVGAWFSGVSLRSFIAIVFGVGLQNEQRFCLWLFLLRRFTVCRVDLNHLAGTLNNFNLHFGSATLKVWYHQI